MTSILASLRIVIATLVICVVGYTALILGIAQTVTPTTANGHLIRNADGQVIGSSQIAQPFTTPRYFWPRPSAVDYNGAGAGGSNKSPTSTDLTERGTEITARYGATTDTPLPADLAAASGAGLDPHISVEGARYQASRVAEARGIARADVMALIETRAFSPGGPFTSDRIVNVLELNLALDRARAG
ncbi:potassium-transporting ATPase subunit C [Sphingomonas sp.]|uniref:potassium-transporting ATPase subunit C n=1 Tax=Sphingomonas sp. TaxID=28214 RepID=UPI002D03494E|nr:potassium-transporting ATPase subunit C [Sphingomonas sp.]HTG39761.1 potassium-transporting ATPase subunit C [Sphingomonas sp.]